MTWLTSILLEDGDVEIATGIESDVSEVLDGQRPLTEKRQVSEPFSCTLGMGLIFLPFH